MPEPQEFFVGYLPTPPGDKRFLVSAGIVLLAIFALLAGLIGASQRDPGSGVWKLDQTTQLSGFLIAEPYPMLFTADATGQIRSVFLVSTGKHGAVERTASLANSGVTIRGHLLQRDAYTMLEIDDETDAMQRADTKVQAPTVSASSDVHTFLGEIIDPKCYLGAMKPGDGKTHKACAVLCMRGGIPPTFVTGDSHGQRVNYLLVDGDGRALQGDALESILPYAADSVELSGSVESRGDVRCLRLLAGSIRRN